MAMVFRSSKTLENPINDENKNEKIYLNRRKMIKNFLDNNKSSNFLTESTSKNNVAFGSSSERSFIYGNNSSNQKSIDLFFSEDNSIKNNFNKEFISGLLNNKISTNNIFISKEKRFKKDKYNNKIPGPGYYFRERKNYNKKKNNIMAILNSFHKSVSIDKLLLNRSKRNNNSKNIEIIQNYNHSKNNSEHKEKNNS